MPLSSLLAAMLLGLQATGGAAPAIEPGTYTNEEQVYFAREAGRAISWHGVIVERVEGALVWQQVNGYGLRMDRPMPVPEQLAARSDGGFDLDHYGTTLRLNRARGFSCWVSVRRHANRADGSADWSFDRNLAVHDQGGRLLVQPDGAPPVVIRMRNVIWPPPSTNRPSLVLYIHRPESPDAAESYSWADPDARMVGINLRWVQASCTREGD